MKLLDPAHLPSRVDALPGMVRLRAALEGEPAYLVGGVVRDLLLGVERADIDIVVEGDVTRPAARLGGMVRSHPRFSTASVLVEGFEVDFASARVETYAHPGALPVVDRATLEQDLHRRDFTINAMAYSLETDELIDPFNGMGDLAAGQLRVLHPLSFVDDPTRAMRAARYKSRYNLELTSETADLMTRVDLTTISVERLDTELRKMAAEDEPKGAFDAAAGWGLIDMDAGASALIGEIERLTAAPPWRGFASRPEGVLAAARGEWSREESRLADLHPEKPSRGLSLVRGMNSRQLLLARALGAAWLDRYVARWRFVRLGISGRDLMTAGIPEGPAIGLGLKAAFEAKVDGEIEGRADEMTVALRVARQNG